MATITTDKFGDLVFDSKSFLYDYNSKGDKVGGQFNIGGKEYAFIPQNIAEKGIISGDKQRYLGNLLVDDNLKALGTEGVYVDLAGVNNYDTAFKEKGWSTTGFLVPAKVALDRKLLTSVRSYDIGKNLGRGMQMGKIQGVSLINEKPVYVTDPMGKAQSTWIQPPGTSGYDGQNVTGTSHGRYTYTKSPFGFIGEVISGIGQAVGSVPFLPEIIGFATGQPLLAAGLRGAAGGAAGMNPLEAGLIGGVSAAGVQAGLNVQAGLDPITGAATTPVSVGGTPGVSQVYAVAPPGGTSAPLPPQAAGFGAADYNLLGTSQFGGIGETGLLQGSTEGLRLPTTPEVAGMGGGQGLTVPVVGGTITGAGFIPVGSTPALGDPSSFINDPNVLGQPVFPAGGSTLSLTDALRGANLANQLMGGQQQAMGMPQQQAPFQPAGVDYSGILGLLGRQASVPNISSLLGPAQIRYPSLLG